MGEKTGWTYIKIPAAIAHQIKPNNKKSFRVKGKLDNEPIAAVALIPMGEGDFIMALKASIRKKLGKQKGATLKVQLGEDKKPFILHPEMMECLSDEPKAIAAFNKLPASYQHYYSNWVTAAKTEPTRIKRIAMVVSSLAKGMNYQEMIRSQKHDKDLLNGPGNL
jgi:hypothetical protein